MYPNPKTLPRSLGAPAQIRKPAALAQVAGQTRQGVSRDFDVRWVMRVIAAKFDTGTRTDGVAGRLGEFKTDEVHR